MEMRNNFQSSFDASSIPHPDPNRPTPTVNPNEMSQFDQLDPVLLRFIQRDDMELHELLKALLWPLKSNAHLNFKLTPSIIPNLDPNLYPMRHIEMPRLGSTENAVFEQPCTTMPPPPLPPQNQPNDTVINRTGLLSDIVNFCSNNEIHLLTASSPKILLSSNGAVAATQGGVNSSDRKSTWSHHEHKLLLVGMEIYGKGEWKKIANNVVITKTYKQVASHAQKYFDHKGKKSKRASIHDTDNVDRRLLSQVRARLGLSYSQ